MLVAEISRISEEQIKARALRNAPPEIQLREGRYHLRFAQTEDDLDAVLRLRFEVFNVELGEGLASSYRTGRDRDEFDAQCHHLMVEDEAGNVIGTYRVQTGAMALAAKGFYSAGEFDLSALPADVLRNAVELGRACIAREHRHTSVLYLLWKGIAAYVVRQRKRYLFGCCSLTSQDAREGRAVAELLRVGGHVHPTFSAPPQRGFACVVNEEGNGERPEAKIPKLFKSYLRFGAKVCSPPAIDREFKTIDYLVMLDVNALDMFSRRMLFGKGA
jgi:putative hemolysin